MVKVGINTGLDQNFNDVLSSINQLALLNRAIDLDALRTLNLICLGFILIKAKKTATISLTEDGGCCNFYDALSVVISEIISL